MVAYVDVEVDVDINEDVSALVNVDVDVYENQIVLVDEDDDFEVINVIHYFLNLQWHIPMLII